MILFFFICIFYFFYFCNNNATCHLSGEVFFADVDAL
ncbi:unnamed protein product [Brassica rapa subsp. narinosa]